MLCQAKRKSNYTLPPTLVKETGYQERAAAHAPARGLIQGRRAGNGGTLNFYPASSQNVLHGERRPCIIRRARSQVQKPGPFVSKEMFSTIVENQVEKPLEIVDIPV